MIQQSNVNLPRYRPAIQRNRYTGGYYFYIRSTPISNFDGYASEDTREFNSCRAYIDPSSYFIVPESLSVFIYDILPN